MRAARKALPLLATALLCACLAAAQAHPGAASPPAKLRKSAAALRAECLGSVGLCVNIPAGWQRVGDVFDDLGFVAAEPHAGADPATWPQLTVAAFQPPATGNGSAAAVPPSLDALVERMLTPEGALASAQTLERSRLLLNGSPAQIVRVQFHDEAGNPAAIEDVALIEGDDGLVYSIALRCAPQDFSRLEPVFRQTAQSWRLQPAAAAPASKPSKPSQPQPKAAHPKPESAKP